MPDIKVELFNKDEIIKWLENHSWQISVGAVILTLIMGVMGKRRIKVTIVNKGNK